MIACSSPGNQEKASGQPPESGMVWVPGGEFTMGTNQANAYPHEKPAHRVRIDGFWMDATEVTNSQFAEFVEATGYVTLAERKPTWEELKSSLPPGTSQPHDSVMVPGSLVFYTPSQPVMLNDFSQWWQWSPLANWKHPEGPDSNLEGRGNHPVVHIAYEDALAYCKWKGRRLPTEAEWEFASRAGKEATSATNANSPNAQGKFVANTFQGSFPINNLNEDGYERTSPVKTFPPNEFGLYDMIGNVWEWTSDYYDINYYASLSDKSISINPKGPMQPFDPNEPFAVKRVTKGGSFLCASNYCSNYRSTARQGTSTDSGSSNIGFRTVAD